MEIQARELVVEVKEKDVKTLLHWYFQENGNEHLIARPRRLRFHVLSYFLNFCVLVCV